MPGVFPTIFQFKDKWGLRDQCYEAHGAKAPAVFGNNPTHDANGTLPKSCAARGFERFAGKLQNSAYDA
eukprot:gene14910-16584_t